MFGLPPNLSLALRGLLASVGLEVDDFISSDLVTAEQRNDALSRLTDMAFKHGADNTLMTALVNGRKVMLLAVMEPK